MGQTKAREIVQVEDAAAEAVGRLWELFDEGDLDGLLAGRTLAELSQIAEVGARLLVLLGGERKS